MASIDLIFDTYRSKDIPRGKYFSYEHAPGGRVTGVLQRHLRGELRGYVPESQSVCARSVFDVLRDFPLHTMLLNEYLKYLSHVF